MSELFFNRGDDKEKKLGIHPQVSYGYLYGYGDNPTVTQRSDGMHSREEIDDEFLARFDEQMNTDPDSVSLADWRLWLQHAWKAEHGTAEAAFRFGGKLTEEHDELTEALEAFIKDPSDANRSAVISEGGDVLWSLCAAVTNAGVSLQTSVQTRLLETALGTTIHEYQYRAGRSVAVEPVWKSNMLEIGTATIRPVTMGDLDALFSTGYQPENSTAMDLDNEYIEPEYPEAVYRDWQRDSAYSVVLRHQFEHQYDADDEFYTISPQRHQQAIAEMAPYLFLRTIYTVRAITGATLAEVVAKNYGKISARIDQGRVDHSDGERSPDLL
jgi:NTP pyrophosphatase (non-canonical NTP hydrolase)